MGFQAFFGRFNFSTSIKSRLIIYLLFLILITNGLLGYQAFTSGKTLTENRIIEHLTSIADLKESELELWVFERTQDVITTALDPEIGEYLESIDTQSGVVGDSSENDFLLQKAQHRLELMTEHYGYKSAFVVDTSGKVLVSTEKEDVGRTLTDHYVTEPLATKETHIHDIFRSSNDDILMAFSSPVYNPIYQEETEHGDRVLGAVVLIMDMGETVFPMIGNWPGMGQSGETLLVRTEGENVLFLNNLRHKENTALNLKIPVSSSIATPAIFASAGDEGILRALDYRNVEVLSAYRYIPSTGWGFVAKIDSKEAFAAVEDLKRRIILFSGLISLFAVGFAFLISKSIAAPILSLEKLTKKISEGDFTIRPEITTRDEIGSLAESFVKMEEALEESRKERQEYSITLEETVEEKTKDLKDKNTELEQIIYVVSHDLRSPLVNIQGFSKEAEKAFVQVGSALDSEDVSSELKEKLAPYLHEDIPEAFQYIYSSTSRMNLLLNGLLRLSRLGRGAITIKSLDMNKVMSEVINNFEYQIQEKDAKVKVDGLPHCAGDEGQINQVFSNLLENALKCLDPKRTGIISISGRKEDGQAVYCVEDNGVGIAGEHQGKVFEIFHRLEPRDVPGEGLGLTIAQKIIDRHYGKIWLESERGRGSRFFVSLPVKIGRSRKRSVK